MKDEVDTITVAVSGIDLNRVEPLDTRRLVTFINHYLATTVSFLNHFSVQCESRLDRMQEQLHRIECRLKLLEGKLASVPGGVVVTPSASTNPTGESPVVAPNKTEEELNVRKEPAPGPEVKQDQEEEREEGANSVASTGAPPGPREDPQYAKYFKMVAVGVPVQAVKHKITQDGLDPSVLDN